MGKQKCGYIYIYNICEYINIITPCVFYMCTCIYVCVISSCVGECGPGRRGEARKEGSIMLSRPPLYPKQMHISIVCMYVYVSMHTAQAQRQ